MSLPHSRAPCVEVGVTMWRDWQVGWGLNPGRGCRWAEHFCSCPIRPPTGMGPEREGRGEGNWLDCDSNAASYAAAESALDDCGWVRSPPPPWKDLALVTKEWLLFTQYVLHAEQALSSPPPTREGCYHPPFYKEARDTWGAKWFSGNIYAFTYFTYLH